MSNSAGMQVGRHSRQPAKSRLLGRPLGDYRSDPWLLRDSSAHGFKWGAALKMKVNRHCHIHISSEVISW